VNEDCLGRDKGLPNNTGSPLLSQKQLKKTSIETNLPKNNQKLGQILKNLEQENFDKNHLSQAWNHNEL
jgi:hypothetical protein